MPSTRQSWDSLPLDRIKSQGQCLVWLGPSVRGAFPIYGKDSIRKRVFEQCFGSIPKGSVVGMSCDTPNCILEDHYVLRSRRMPPPHKNKVSSRSLKPFVTPDIVEQWRELQSKGMSIHKIARTVGYSKSTVHRYIGNAQKD